MQEQVQKTAIAIMLRITQATAIAIMLRITQATAIAIAQITALKTIIQTIAIDSKIIGLC